jgi:hypothetical protein
MLVESVGNVPSVVQRVEREDKDVSRLDQCEGCRMVSCAQMSEGCPELNIPPGAAAN